MYIFDLCFAQSHQGASIRSRDSLVTLSDGHRPTVVHVHRPTTKKLRLTIRKVPAQYALWLNR